MPATSAPPRGRAARRPVRLRAALALTALPMLTAAATALGAQHDVRTTAALQSAVRESGPGDVVVLAPGTYAPVATLDVDHDLTIRGPRSGRAVISGASVVATDPPHLVQVDGGVRVTLADLTLTSSPGEAFAAEVRGALRLENATVSGALGPAVVVENGGALTTLNATVSDNADVGVVVMPGGQALLSSSTIAQNTQGGIYNDRGSVVRLRNSVVANSRNADASDCFAPVQAADASLDFDGTCHANATGDPLLGPLTANGGPTGTRVPSPASPLVDSGAGCPAEDQRHAARTVGACDIGAVEVGATISAAPAVCRPVIATARRDRARLVVASGRLTGRRGVAVLGLRLTARGSAWRGGGVYRDARRRVRLRLPAPAAVRVERGGRSVVFRVTARDLVRRRGVCTTVRMTTRTRRGATTTLLSIRTAGGYRRSGAMTASRVRIVPLVPAQRPRQGGTK